MEGATFRLYRHGSLVLVRHCDYCGTGHFESPEIKDLADLGYALLAWHPLHEDCVQRIRTHASTILGAPSSQSAVRAGLAGEGFTLHSLRHTYATTLAARGVNPATAQKMLGHSDIRMTLTIYIHATDKTQDAATAALESAFG